MSKAQVLVRVLLVILASICLTRGMAYTPLTPAYDDLPPALNTLVGGESGQVWIFGAVWLALAFVGVWSAFNMRIEPFFWYGILGMFGLWGGMYIGGAITTYPRSWVGGALYLQIGAVFLVVWIVTRLLLAQDRLVHSMQATMEQHREAG